MDWSYINGCKYQGLNYLDQPIAQKKEREEVKMGSESGAECQEGWRFLQEWPGLTRLEMNR